MSAPTDVGLTAHRCFIVFGLVIISCIYAGKFLSYSLFNFRLFRHKINNLTPYMRVDTCTLGAYLLWISIGGYISDFISNSDIPGFYFSYTVD